MFQNVSRKILLSGVKFETKIPSHSRVFVIEIEGRATEIHPTCEDKGLRDHEHKMSMVLDTRESNFECQ